MAALFFTEAAELARELGDFRSLAQIIGLEWMTGRVLDEPAAAQAAAEEGLRVAEEHRRRFPLVASCRYVLAWAQVLRGDLVGCVARLGEVIDEAMAANDLSWAMAVLDHAGPMRWPISEISRTRGHGQKSTSNAHPSPSNSTKELPRQLWAPCTLPRAMRLERGTHTNPRARAPRWTH